MFPPTAPKSFKRTLQAINEELHPQKRGSGMLFRTYYTNHLDLSRIADRKAHFMIGMNVFLVSLVITRKHMGVLSHSHYLLWPNLILLASSLGSIVLAIVATRPVIPKRPRTGDTGPVNWFFFGSYCHRPLQEFHDNIQQLMMDDDAMLSAMTRDLHLMGNSLAKKYRLLTRCYQFFYYGLFLAVVAYLVAFGWHYLH
ncbi:MAG: Pycsar system effector family protein [Saprospiraceae bacterium]